VAHSGLNPNSGYSTTDKISNYFKSKENKIVIVFAISFYLKALTQMCGLGPAKEKSDKKK